MGIRHGFIWVIGCLMVLPAWAEEAAVQVRAAALAGILFHPEREVSAEVVAMQRSRVSSQVAGILGKILVEVGDRVVKGEVLARLDCWQNEREAARSESEVAALKAEIGLARRQKDRASVLQQQGQGTKEALDRRESEVLALEARLHSQQIALETWRVWLEKCEVKAPFAGVILSRDARLGEWAAMGTPLFEVLDDRAVELSARIDPVAALDMNRMEKTEFIHGEEHHGVKLRVVLPFADRTTRSREARFEFVSGVPLAGTAGRLHWLDVRWHLPAWLLVRRQEVLGVFLVKDGFAHFHPLPEAQEGRPAVWAEGVEPESQVILDGREGLRHGQRITTEAKPKL